MNRRHWLKSVLGTGALIGAPMINLGRYRLFADSPRQYSARAINLVQRSTVIDMLSPLTLDFAGQAKIFNDPSLLTSEELQRYRDSGIRIFHTAVGILSDDAYGTARQHFQAWNRFLAYHERHFVRIDKAGMITWARKSGRIGILLGLQNSDHFRRLEDVETFHSWGQRVSQLTYNFRNLLGTGCTEPHDEGLTQFGVDIARRMNQAGMAIDVSHCGDRTTLDACAASKKPVLVTHSNCRAIAGHPRCKTDEAIKRMARTGGVMGITGMRMFVKTEEPVTIEHVLDHFDHVARLVGVEHIGIGSDSDLLGYDRMPPNENQRFRSLFHKNYGFRDRIDIDGLNHPKRIFDLTEGLIRRKYGNRAIEAILGSNFERALSSIWRA